MIVKGSDYSIESTFTITKNDEYWEYKYDLLNRLTAVYKWDEDTSAMVLIKKYKYNISGYRAMSTDADGESTYYTFDTTGRMIERTDDSTRDYIYIGSRIIAHVEDGETYYYGTDHIGSTVLITDEDGDSVWTGSVTPFADQENASGDEHVMYTGKELDEDTGLYYYNARWYIAELYESTVHTILPTNAKLKELDDPNLGRFTTEDLVRSGLNWYAYAGNNPLKFVDPTGLTTGTHGGNVTYSIPDDDDEDEDEPDPTPDPTPDPELSGPSYDIYSINYGAPDSVINTSEIKYLSNECCYNYLDLVLYEEPVYSNGQLIGYGSEAEARKRSLDEWYGNIYGNTANMLGNISIMLVGAGIVATIIAPPAVPVFLFASTFLDVSSSGLYAIQGDYMSMALSGLSAFSGVIPSTIKYNAVANRYISKSTGRFISFNNAFKYSIKQSLTPIGTYATGQIVPMFYEDK
ncbi:MAG: RHS repeat-associated core domain-containing protein [Spirochaetales bacterium]|nr:RHS repeat-associated core domain-containing protein [Spirochaetales bacterium]